MAYGDKKATEKKKPKFKVVKKKEEKVKPKPKPKFKVVKKKQEKPKPKPTPKFSKEFNRLPQEVKDVIREKRGENIPLHGNLTDEEFNEARFRMAKRLFQKGSSYTVRGETVDTGDFTRGFYKRPSNEYKITNVGKKFLSMKNEQGKAKRLQLKFARNDMGMGAEFFSSNYGYF